MEDPDTDPSLAGDNPGAEGDEWNNFEAAEGNNDDTQWQAAEHGDGATTVYDGTEDAAVADYAEYYQQDVDTTEQALFSEDGSQFMSKAKDRALLYTNFELQDEAALFSGTDQSEQPQVDGNDNEWDGTGYEGGAEGYTAQQAGQWVEGDYAAEDTEWAEAGYGAADAQLHAEGEHGAGGLVPDVSPQQGEDDEELTPELRRQRIAQLELREVLAAEERIRLFWVEEEALFQQYHVHEQYTRRQHCWKRAQATLDIAHDLATELMDLLEDRNYTLQKYQRALEHGNLTVENPLIRGGIEVDLGNCLLTRVPPKLFDSKRIRSTLTHLDLSDNRIQYIPEQFWACQHLVRLDLHGNRIASFYAEPEGSLENQSIWNVFSFIPSNLTELRFLDLSHNSLEDLPNFLRIPNLETLDLSYNALTTVPEEVCDGMPYLRYLNLSHNKLQQCPSKALQLLTSLRILDLSHNGMESIGAEIGEIGDSLQVLDLQTNVLESLPEEMMSLRSLTDLVLEDNKITHLPQKIGKLTTLKNLLLRNNSVASLPINELTHGTELDKCKSLETLDLTNNCLEGQLGEEVGRCKALKRLLVANNRLNALPDTVGTLLQLQELDLQQNGLESVPDSFSKLVSLQRLQLARNAVAALPSFTDLSHLQEVDLRENGLTQLPDGFFSSGLPENAVGLDLSANSIQSLPQALGSFQQLKLLNVSHNELDELPSQIGQVLTLEMLLVHHNQIGHLPTEIGQLTNLQRLDVAFNRLDCFPTTAVAPLLQLRCLSLAGNQIESIPKEAVFHLSKLGDLDVGFNHLPAVPTFFQKMPNLLRVVSTGNSKRVLKESHTVSSLTPGIENTPASSSTKKHDEASAPTAAVASGKSSPTETMQANDQGQKKQETSVDGVETKNAEKDLKSSEGAAGSLLTEETKADTVPKQSTLNEADVDVASDEPVHVPAEGTQLNSTTKRHSGKEMPKNASLLVQDNSVKARISRSKQHLKDGDVQQALQEVDAAARDSEEALRKHNVPLDEEAFNLRATIRAEVGDFKGAARDLTVCMDLGMLSNDAFLKRGEYLFRGGDTAAALEDLGVVLRRKNDSVPALRLRATVLLQLGRYGQAEDDIDTLLAFDEQNQQAFCLKAECMIKLGKLDPAREYLDACISANPDWKRPYLIRGKLLAGEYFKSYTKASKDLNFLITDDWDVPLEDLVDAYMTRAFMYQSQSRALKAKSDFNTAMDLRRNGKPSHDDAHGSDDFLASLEDPLGDEDLEAVEGGGGTQEEVGNQP